MRMAAMFTAFLFISAFHWLGRARLDTVRRAHLGIAASRRPSRRLRAPAAPRAPQLEAQEHSQWLKTLRIGFLYGSLTVWDTLLAAFCTLQCFTDAGFDPSIFVLFAFEVRPRPPPPPLPPPRCAPSPARACTQFAALLVEAAALNLRFLLYLLELRLGEWPDKVRLRSLLASPARR